MVEPRLSGFLPFDRSRRLWRHWWVRWPAWVIVALLVFWGVTWLAVPPLVKWQGQKIATAELGRTVRIGAVQFNPWALALTLRDVSVAGAKPADPPQFAAKRLYANLSLESVWRLAPIMDAIAVDEPMLRLRHLGNGHYDVDDIIARLNAGPQSPPDAQPTRFALYNITVQGGSLTFIDDPVKRTHEVRDVRLTLPFISNLPSQHQMHVMPQLAFTVDGSRFDSGAQTLPFDASHRTDAHLRIQRFDLAPYLVYQPASLPVRLTAGMLDADLHLTFEETPHPSIKVAGTVNLSGVKVNDAANQTALAFDRLSVDASDVRPLERQVHLTSVELTAPHVLVSRDAQGQLNWVPASAAAPAAATPTQAAMGTTSAPKAADKTGRKSPKSAAGSLPAHDWHVTVDRVAIAQGDLQWRDAQPASGSAAKAEPAAVHVTPFALEAKNVTWPAQQAITFNGRLALADTGVNAAVNAAPAGQAVSATHDKPLPNKPALPASATSAASTPFIAFEGQAQMSAAKVKVQARGLPLQLAQPYLAAFLKPTLTGAVDADADVAWSAPKADGTGKAPSKSADKNADAGPAAPELTVDVSKLALSHLTLLDNATDAHTAPRRHRSNQPDLPPGTLASIDALTLEGAKLDLPGRSVAVDTVTVQAPRVRVTRDRDGHWMYEDWLAKPGATSEPPAQPAQPPQHETHDDAQPQPWAVRIGHAVVTAGGIGWRDQQPASGTVAVALSQLTLDARDFELGGHKPMPLELSAQLAARRGEPGKLSWRGAVGIAPVSVQGQIDAERLPLQAFEPYVADFLNVDILRADTSFKGKVDYLQQDAGPRLHVVGDARIEELHTTSHPGSAAANDVAADDINITRPTQSTAVTRHDDTHGSAATAGAAAASVTPEPTSRAMLAPDAADASSAASGGSLGEELLSWKQLRVAGLNVQLAPEHAPQITIKDSQLSDFYARVIVHPNGRINLQDLVKTAAPAQSAAAAASASAPASVAASAASGAGTPSDVPVMHFGPTRLINGRVSFSDHFIRPNYSADLTQLDGSLGAFSSVTNPQTPQMADLQLTGRAQSTAQLTISGKLNPLAQPLALDIAAKINDLELPPLSPYSIKYSGHGIERGKLSMDVAYKIAPNGMLTATNKLVLKQLQFGQQVPGAPASLPVTLATTLLADSDGVIDLDLPISGSLNDPQFSIGPVIFKAVMNLVGKAITAPFSLLAHAFGGSGSTDMSQVPFAPGSSVLSDAAKTQLDKVAKALTDRPQLKLTVVGAARLDEEREGFKRERLKALVAAQRRANGTDADTPSVPTAGSAASQQAFAAASEPASAAASAAAAQTSAADYPKILRQLYRRADIPGKPRNLIGMTKDVPVAQMESLLLAHITVGENDIQQLATERAVAVKDYLLAQHLSADRIFIGAAKAASPNRAASGATPAAPAPPASTAASAVEPSTSHWTPYAELELSSR